MFNIFNSTKYVPTDLEVLNKIYHQYYDNFTSYSKDNPDRTTKIFVPIDIEKIANELDVDGDIVFGRLYYHLNEKHGYRKEDDSMVHLFAKVIGNDKHCVNFPLVASVLADLRRQNKKFWIATGVAIFSLIVSVGSLIVSLLV